jgi:NADH-ubiquinone oxidoreductase chain 4
MLLALLLIPLAGIFGILPISNKTAQNASLIKRITLLTIILNFLLSILLWGQFDSIASQYQFVQEFNNFTFCHFHIGVDGISLYFVLLTSFLMPICLVSNWNNVKNNLKFFLSAFLLLEALLITFFLVLDLILFYVFFESVLIPLFLIISIYGGSEIRVRASFLLFLYTLTASLFMLLAIIVIYYNIGSTDFIMISLANINLDSQKLLWLAFFLSFAVKTPLIPLHIWLPRAHAEAPLAGSIILAGIILKISTYGFLRVLIPFLPDATNYFVPLVHTIAVVSLVYSSLATLRQTDIKCLVAYSSISHISIVVLGLFSNTILGIEGAILLSLAHGIISPAMFILVGGVIYERGHTRIIRYFRGLAVYMPVFSVLFFITTAFNMAVPLSLNWAGEFMSLAALFQRSPLVGGIAASSIVLSAAYSIFLFNRITFGAYSPYLTQFPDINRREFFLVFPLLALTLIFGIFPNIILNDIHVPVTQLLYTTA